MNYKTIQNCRLCGSNKLVDIFSLGNHFVNTFPSEWPYNGPKCPIELIKCESCTMLQSRHTAPNDLLYSGHYWFKSGINKTIVENLKNIAELAMKGMSEGDAILDIGANDGTLLSFVDKKFKRIGVEPAKNLFPQLEKYCDVAIDDFWKGYDEKVKVICAIGMFYDTEDPVKFLIDAKNSLQEDGIFITEMMTTPQMVEARDLGNLCHEHLMFYTKETIRRLFEMSGLEIFSITLNPLSEDGKGYRILARHWKTGHCEMEEEDNDIAEFIKGIEQSKKDMLDFLSLTDKVYIYGASTKANTVLQYYGIGPDKIRGAIDKDSDKIGKYLLTGIPIIGEEHIQNAEFLWCLPYPFLEKFREREKENFKGAWIVTNPEFKIYG